MANVTDIAKAATIAYNEKDWGKVKDNARNAKEKVS